MRVGFPGGPRLEWYDRNPILTIANYQAGNVAPHSLTVRWTYTVPTGKKALLTALFAELVRITAATTAGQAFAGTYINDQAVLQPCVYGNTADMGRLAATGLSSMLLAGNTIKGETYDGSTGGTFFYSINVHINEFDA